MERLEALAPDVQPQVYDHDFVPSVCRPSLAPQPGWHCEQVQSLQVPSGALQQESLQVPGSCPGGCKGSWVHMLISLGMSQASPERSIGTGPGVHAGYRGNH